MPGPCELRSTGPPDRMARRTSGRRRLRRPTPYHPTRQIVLDRTAGALQIAVLVPVLTRDRPLLIGVSLNQACVDCKTFATDQTGRDARLDDPLEYTTENIPLAEALVARTRKRRVVRDSILDAELAEPAIGEVHLYFTTDQPLRADRKDIPRVRNIERSPSLRSKRLLPVI